MVPQLPSHKAEPTCRIFSAAHYWYSNCSSCCCSLHLVESEPERDQPPALGYAGTGLLLETALLQGQGQGPTAADVDHITRQHAVTRWTAAFKAIEHHTLLFFVVKGVTSATGARRGQPRPSTNPQCCIGWSAVFVEGIRSASNSMCVPAHAIAVSRCASWRPAFTAPSCKQVLCW